MSSHDESIGREEPVAAFLAAVVEQDAARARDLFLSQPAIASRSLHAAAALGLPGEAARLVADDPSRVRSRATELEAEPLLFLCYSPFHGESAERDAGLLETARLLLAAGADPNTTDRRFGVPALFAVTGARSVLPIARLLLDAGAKPTDGESVFHAAEHFHEDALELLLEAGADLNATGEWGNTPLYFLLRWHDLEREPRVADGVRWLLAHGADPNVPSGTERESALHVAARRGQGAWVVDLLLEHGAEVNARRGDGRTPWQLASRGGFDAVVARLESAGARSEPLSPAELLLAACGRGDADAARRLSTPALVGALPPEDLRLLPEAVADRRRATVAACLAAGFPVSALDAGGATALHHAALRGDVETLRLLLDAGAGAACLEVRDGEHSSTPLGWACWGADFVRAPGGDYAECVRRLLAAGARPEGDGHVPRDEGVRAALGGAGEG